MKKIDNTIEIEFFNVREKLHEHSIFMEKNDSYDFLLKYKYKLFGKYLSKTTNYDFCSKSFNKSFFFKNLLKCMLFFQHFQDLKTNQIFDIGCGAATASIAFSIMIKDKVQVNLIDKSDTQLKLALEFLEMLDIPLNTCQKIDFKPQNIIYNGLAVFSYFLCEQDSNKFIEDLYYNRNNFRNGFVIIDYENNIKKIYKYFKLIEDKTKLHIINETYMLSKGLSNILNDNEVKIYGFLYKP